MKPLILTLLSCVILYSVNAQDLWHNLNTENSDILSDQINSVLVDTENNLWVAYAGAGGTGHGISKFTGTEWTHYNSINSGLPNDDIRAMALDAAGNIWFGCYNAGLVKFNGTTWTRYHTGNSGIAGDGVTSIKLDHSGNLWIGGYFDGVSKFNGTTWTVYNKSNAPFGQDVNCINALTIDSNNNVWVGLGCDGGLAKLTVASGTWTKYTTANSGLAHNYVTALVQDAEGKIWIGYSGYSALTNFDGTTWQTVESFDPMEFNGVSYDGFVADQDDNIWCGSYRGLYKYNGTTWNKVEDVGSETGLSGFNQSVAVDENNFIWWSEQNHGIWTSIPNFKPHGVAFSVQLLEDEPYTFNPIDFTSSFRDSNEGDELQQIQIVTLPSMGKLLNGDSELAIGDILTTTSLEALQFVPNENANGSTSFNVYYHDGAENSAEPVTITLVVLPVNDPVRFEFPETMTLDEDFETFATELVLTVPEDELDDPITVTIETISGQAIVQASLNPNPRLITWEAIENISGEEVFLITVTENLPSMISMQTSMVTVTVLPVNDPPTISTFQDLELNTEETVSQNFNIGDIDSPLTSLTVTATSSDQTIVSNEDLSVTGSIDQFTVSLVPQTKTGVTTISVVVNDGEHSTTQQFEVSMDWPVITGVENHVERIVRIYPNPATEQVTVEPRESGQALNVTISDVSGRTIRSIEVTEKIIIPVSDLRQGLYLLRVAGKNLNPEVYKIIKN